jgi:hypothetical protein
MKFVIDIDMDRDGDLLEIMFKRRLVEDYKLIVSSIDELENLRFHSGLEDYQVQDLVDHRDDKFCFERLLLYYFGTDWRSEINKIPGDMNS